MGVPWAEMGVGGVRGLAARLEAGVVDSDGLCDASRRGEHCGRVGSVTDGEVGPQVTLGAGEGPDVQVVDAEHVGDGAKLVLCLKGEACGKGWDQLGVCARANG
jgi:hypothetical protein